MQFIFVGARPKWRHVQVRIGAVACFTLYCIEPLHYCYPSLRIAFRMNVAHSGRFLEVSMTQCQVSLLPVKIEEENVFFNQIGHLTMV